MILAHRIIPFLTPIVLIILLLGLLFDFNYWPWWCAGIGLLMLVAIKYLWPISIFSFRLWMSFFPLVMLTAGGVGLLFFLDSRVIQFLWVALIVLFVSVYLEIFFVFHYQPQRYIQLSLPHIVTVMNTLAGFSLFAFLFALNLIGMLSSWVITAAAFCFAVLLLVNILWSYKIWQREFMGIVVFVAILFAELTWILQFWPTTFYVNGLIMAIAFYCLPSIIQLQLRGALTRPTALRYTIISAVALVSVVSSAQWT